MRSERILNRRIQVQAFSIFILNFDHISDNYAIMSINEFHSMSLYISTIETCMVELLSTPPALIWWWCTALTLIALTKTIGMIMMFIIESSIFWWWIAIITSSKWWLLIIFICFNGSHKVVANGSTDSTILTSICRWWGVPLSPIFASRWLLMACRW